MRLSANTSEALSHNKSMLNNGVPCMFCRYAKLDFGGDFDKGKNPPALPVRYSIDTDTGDVTQSLLFDGYNLDFPVIPLHLITRPCKYSYMTGHVAGTCEEGVKHSSTLRRGFLLLCAVLLCCVFGQYQEQSANSYAVARSALCVIDSCISC